MEHEIGHALLLSVVAFLLWLFYTGKSKEEQFNTIYSKFTLVENNIAKTIKIKKSTSTKFVFISASFTSSTIVEGDSYA